MRFIGVLGGGVICLVVALVVPPQRPAVGQSPTESPVAREFDGKVLLITARIDGKSEVTTLKKVSTRRLGGREFLIGEYVLVRTPVDEPSPWRGVREWVPMDMVERIQVFNDLDQVRGVYRDYIPSPEILPPQQATGDSRSKSSSKFLIPPTNIPNNPKK